MIASMSGKGDCYDNAVAESFFSTLEFELLMQNDWHTREEARRAIFRYIEIVVQPEAPSLDPRLRQPGRRTKSSCRRRRSSYHSRVHQIGASPIRRSDTEPGADEALDFVARELPRIAAAHGQTLPPDIHDFVVRHSS